jgi:hypothetical protein
MNVAAVATRSDLSSFDELFAQLRPDLFNLGH